MNNSLASHKLAEEFLIIPYPFPPDDRQNLEAEYRFLLDSGITPKEISEMVLYALEILLYKRKETKDQKAFDKITAEISDMLGRLLILEELLTHKRNK